jgi:hypothetical protein
MIGRYNKPNGEREATSSRRPPMHDWEDVTM